MLISKSNFNNNVVNAYESGGALAASHSNIKTDNSEFSHNLANDRGGAIIAIFGKSGLQITSSRFYIILVVEQYSEDSYKFQLH